MSRLTQIQQKCFSEGGTAHVESDGFSFGGSSVVGETAELSRQLPGERNRTMSRSKRKNPIFPRCSSDSEKEDKFLVHRKERSRVRDALTQLNQDTEVEPYIEHPRSGRWNFAKDGKTYVPDANTKERSK